jgi:hypothetical protein
MARQVYDMVNTERFRPDRAAEDNARQIVRRVYPQAMSTYTDDGAVVYDAGSEYVIGRAEAGDWAVEAAWQDAASALARR